MGAVWLGRSDSGYEQARQDTVWNGRTPPRYPDVIVKVESVEDVIDAVRHAADHGMRISVRSGGHSWAGSHLRDGGVVLDLSRLDQLQVDREAMVAVVGPGLCGIAGALEPTGTVLPGRTQPRSGRRRLPAAGRLWMERPRLRTGVPEHPGDRRRHRRGRADSRRRRRSPRSPLGGARRRTRVFWGGGGVPSAALSRPTPHRQRRPALSVRPS